MSETPTSIDELVVRMQALDASDLHLTQGSQPMVRIRGELRPLVGYGPLSAEATRELVYGILSTEQHKILETRRQLDMAYTVPGVARLRVNAFFQRESLGAALRVIPTAIRSLQ